MVIVFERLGRPLGLLAAEPLDMVEAALNIDTVTLRQRGIAGSAVLKDRTILLLDIFELADAARPEGGATGSRRRRSGIRPGDAPTVLVADDSDFFRGQIQRLVEAVGCRVLAAEDGQAAWEILDHHAGEVDLVATDIEMPRLDGLALTRQIRADRALCRVADHRAVLAGRRGRDRPRHGCRRRRVSNQAQQGRVNGEHSQGGRQETERSGPAGMSAHEGRGNDDE